MKTTVRTMCNRDCPDACAILADVEDGRVTALRGDPDHPVTQGFLCHRTNRFLSRQYGPQRLTQPRLRGREVSWEEALDEAAAMLLRVREESGPAAILHYRSGGSLGLLKEVNSYFFEQFGPVTVKSGDICSGAGDEAQMEDFGYEDVHDIHDVLNARHILNWGKNVFVSSVHMLPVLKAARAKGIDVTCIDPIHSRSVALADRYLAVRPGGDVALALAVGQVLFDSGRVCAAATSRCDHVAEFEALCRAQSMTSLLGDCDLTLEDVRFVADVLADGPTCILVGWGMQRRLQGAATVRLLDALAAISGNLGRSGGGVQFSASRRRPFNLRFKGVVAPPRVFPEPLLGQCIEAAQDPPVRLVWIDTANPVAMLPDSARVARALSNVEFSVVVDAFETDTTRRATLVLPTTTMLEDDDLVGSYGHHYVGTSRPVVPPPPGVLTDLQILQDMARRVGLGDVMQGSARDWKARLLDGGSVRLEQLEQGPVRHAASPPVLFADGQVRTRTGRVNLIHSLPDAPADEPDFPLWLFSNSTDRSQSSQWADEPDGALTATIHPRAVPGLAHGAQARLVSAIGTLDVRIAHDGRQRRDIVLVPKGGHFDRGHAANVLIRARTTDRGDGAAYQDARVRLEPL